METPLSAKDVGALIGLNSDTVRRYLFESSAPGRRYSKHPFPAPRGRIGRSPYWTKDQIPAIKAWDDARPGPGAFGGRKAKDSNG